MGEGEGGGVGGGRLLKMVWGRVEEGERWGIGWGCRGVDELLLGEGEGGGVGGGGWLLEMVEGGRRGEVGNWVGV